MQMIFVQEVREKMSRLIDADELNDVLDKEIFRKKREGYLNFEMVEVIKNEFVENAPTIDAEPIRHGRWVMDKGYNECSICGCNEVVTPYCPQCGAKMDEVEE